jgi:uncharacterized membrane protein (DUF2068 family)
MRSAAITTSAVLLALLSLTNLPFPWEKVFPGEDVPPDFIVMISTVLGIAGLIAAVGLWLLKRWSYWLTIVVGIMNVALSVLGATQVQGAGIRIVLIVSAVIAMLIIVLVALPSSRGALRRTA